jgi:acetyl-CoA carboxylase beta subunit
MPIKDYIDSNDFYDLSIGNDKKPNKKHTQNTVNISTFLISESKVSYFIHPYKSFKTGTIEIVEGEKITSAFECATKRKSPVIAIVAAGVFVSTRKL